MTSDKFVDRPRSARIATLARYGVRVARDTYREARNDDLAGEAAKMAYFFFLSLFPLIVVVFSLTGIFGGDAAFTRIATAARSTMPDYAWQFVRELIREVTENNSPGTLSFGIVLTIWAASGGITALTGALNTIYDVREPRSWWRRRLLGVGVLMGGVILIVLGSVAFIPTGDWLRDSGLGAAWRLLKWPLTILFLTGTAWLAYHFLPARNQGGVWWETLIGALVASVTWIVATLLFRFYIANYSRYSRVYGTLGAVIVLLLWFYLSALAVLVGGELAATLESRRGRRGKAGRRHAKQRSEPEPGAQRRPAMRSP